MNESKTNSYIIRMNREDNLCWFHGKVSRDRAEQILREEGMGDGVFLVRESSSADGDYVLSVLHHGEVWHYQIRRHGEDAFFSIDDQQPIHGLDSLIEHYQEASHGLVTQLSAIVKRDPPPHDSRSHGRTNLLHRATKEGDLTVVSELLRCGYRNIDAKNQDGQTAVHLACRYQNEQMIRKLIDSGANVNCRDSDGNTPLHYACRTQPASVIKILIDAKANIQARNNGNGCVPLHEAARQGNMQAVREMLSHGAPHMPRSTFGELPIDFAKEGGHIDVAKYLENYKPPQPDVYKYQWYHGTLDRSESNAILKQHAISLGKKDEDCASVDTSPTQSSTNNEDLSKDPESDFSSGVFLIRFSENSGDDVLTLLFDYRPKHFIIQKYLSFLYIDEGPYMPSLEHLVQHYMQFSDGLPINLRYSVPPKPKPPLPLFSTIPRKERKKIVSPVVDKLSTIMDFRTKSSLELNLATKYPPQRNMSIPSDDLMNTVGIAISPTNSKNKGKDKDKDRNTDLLSFRSLKLKSPKKRNIIIDGMKSLKKSKAKMTTPKEVEKNELDEIAPSLKNLSFSTDLKLIDGGLYNVPTNNTAVSDLHSRTSDDIANQNAPQLDIQNNNSSMSQDYFVEGDNSSHADHDKDSEEIYFVDAPMIKNDVPSTSFNYVQFKHVPYFPDGSPQVLNNNNPIETMLSNDSRFNRLDSTISTSSIDSEYLAQHKLIIDSRITKPNYFIPKSNLQLNEILGEGEFGSVYKGVLKYANGKDNQNCSEIPVAIKTLHDEHCKQNRAEFLREASVMIKLSHHCIVKLIGISKGPPLMMVQELVPLGSMLTYLIEHPTEINANFELKIWASQIAAGMSYLESHHFVHRDLAARNCLLSSKHQAKISDFGLSRALSTESNYYQASQGGKWPIKWYAPESFNYGIFSHASDVWSFGVTLWEIWSGGQPPWGDMKGVEVIKLVEIGKRLKRSASTPDNVYRIMENCWNYNPKDRPTFQYLKQFFANDPGYQNLVELINTEDIS